MGRKPRKRLPLFRGRMMDKTHVYVDGFNLYYSLLRIKPLAPKWLDIKSMCELMVRDIDIERIKYFTARVSETPDDADKPIRQQIYFRALRSIPELEIYYGHFMRHIVRQPLGICKSSPLCFVDVQKTEEKGSDVNLASHLLHDAHLGRFELAIVVSGDSDLVEPIRMVTKDLGQKVCVINPNPKPSKQLRKFATFYRTLEKSAIHKAQFPESITDRKGTFSKPRGWTEEWIPRQRNTLVHVKCPDCGKSVKSHRYSIPK